MRTSRRLVLAAALAAALAAPGCKRDFKAPEPKAGSAEGMTSPANSGGLPSPGSNPRISAGTGTQ